MPVSLVANHPNLDRSVGVSRQRRQPAVRLHDRSSRYLSIGLINNMPDAALEATERQFRTLLDSASDGIPVRLSLYTLPNIARAENAGLHVRRYYSSVETLWGQHLDGLIVTGREPLSPNLKDEPYWASFTQVVDWARDHTHSTIWSCLAAHAAVLHLDGIGRRRSSDKHFGIFDCARQAVHRLTAGMPPSFKTPHSRWNGLSEVELKANGYTMLTGSTDVGVDAFIKQAGSLFLFFQGHPEYDSDTLLREYRRDVGRYLNGEASTYPLMPRSYFNESTTESLMKLGNAAISCRNDKLLPEVAAALAGTSIENGWRSTATSIYRTGCNISESRKDQFTIDATRLRAHFLQAYTTCAKHGVAVP